MYLHAQPDLAPRPRLLKARDPALGALGRHEPRIAIRSGRLTSVRAAAG
jgi:hypothetical protein